MKNKIDRALNGLDSLLMKGVNATVKSYNYVTGGTKSELANGLLTLAPIASSTGAFLVFHDAQIPLLTVPAMGTVAKIYISHEIMEENIKHDHKERQASKERALNLEAEEYRANNSVLGYVVGATGAFTTASSLTALSNPKSELNGYGGLLYSLGLSLYSASFFVMRADYHPPRKNCIRRGLENLTSLISIIRAKPARIPIT